MKFKIWTTSFQTILFLLILVASFWLISIEGANCRPSGRLRGKKPPSGKCNRENESECCKKGKVYHTFKCSPPISHHTKAILTLNSFEKGGDGGGPSECDNKFYSDNTPVVALSTGWFNDKKRCHHNITIFGKGRRVHAMVVDECDSKRGCDAEHDFLPPCPNNVVDASKAVWKALGVPKRDWGESDIHWSDAWYTIRCKVKLNNLIRMWSYISVTQEKTTCTIIRGDLKPRHKKKVLNLVLIQSYVFRVYINKFVLVVLLFPKWF